MNVIETSGLGKRYGRTWALKDASVAIPAGYVVALVGPNGAGKTTLLHMSVGLTTPTTGQVTVLGNEPAGSPAALDQIAFVAQDAPLYKNLSVADMLHLTRNLNRTLGPAACRDPAEGAGHPAEPQGRQAVRRPAGPARAHRRGGQAAPAAGPRRAAVQPRPAGPARLHGLAHGGGGRGRAVGGAVLARARRPGTGRRLPDRAVPRPGAGGRRGRGTAGRAQPR